MMFELHFHHTDSASWYISLVLLLAVVVALGLIFLHWKKIDTAAIDEGKTRVKELYSDVKPKRSAALNTFLQLLACSIFKQ